VWGACPPTLKLFSPPLPTTRQPSPHRDAKTRHRRTTNQPYNIRLTMPDATVVELNWKTLRGGGGTPDRKPFSRFDRRRLGRPSLVHPFTLFVISVVVLAVVRAGVSSLCPPSAWWASVHLCLVAFSKPSARSVPECGTDRAEGDTATLLTVPPDERPSAASSGVWRRDGAHVRRGAKLRRRSAVGGSCPPSYVCALSSGADVHVLTEP